MSEKKVKDTPEMEPQEGTVGAMLRAARTKKNLSLEEVSKALRIRATQLRDIEGNNTAALPGMTYAVGFVRSYANYLGLNGAEVVQQFKTENNQDPDASKLTFPEPVAESRMPDPIMIGIGAFLAIVVLVIWSITSNSGAAPKVADVPEAPVVAAETPAAPVHETTLPAETAAALVGAASTPAAAATETPAVIETVKPAEPAAVVTAPAKTEEKPVVAAVEAPKEAKPAETAKAEKTEAKSEEQKSEVINVKRGKTRITLTATQDSWIQVSDTRKGVIYKKVLRPGESYSVPDQTGLSLVTANAGGIDVFVDGQKAPSVGRVGEIVRGVVLDPEQLKKKRMRVND